MFIEQYQPKTDRNNCFGIWYKYFSTCELFVTFLFIVSYCIVLQFKPEGKYNRLLQVRQITVPFNWFSSACLWMANQWHLNTLHAVEIRDNTWQYMTNTVNTYQIVIKLYWHIFRQTVSLNKKISKLSETSIQI
jgi:hypothetical protein